jgi:hypothetical protein
MGIDYERGLVRVEAINGEVLEERLESEARAPEVGVSASLCLPAARELRLALRHGDTARIRLPDRTAPNEAPPGPVIYLDQLHWIAVAQCLHSPEKLGKDELEASERLLGWARASAITLPLSAANMVEATKLDGPQRRDLGTVLLQLSAGWQMRSPIAVRGGELRSSISGGEPVAEGVVTLEPGAAAATPPEPLRVAEDLPVEWAQWFQDITTASAFASTLVDEEALPIVEGLQMAGGWGEKHQRLAEFMRDHHVSKEHARINTQAMLIADLRKEIASAAATVGAGDEAFQLWLDEGLERDLSRMPYLGRQHEVIYHRLRNAQDYWEPNDLFDLNFLSCAAGYVDLVVTENKFSHYLQRAQSRVPAGAVVVAKLPEAVRHIEDLLANRVDR